MKDTSHLILAAALMGACGSSPTPACPSDAATLVSQDVCTACGAAGGCATRATQCARTCASQTDCAADGLMCLEGVCQVGGCI